MENKKMFSLKRKAEVIIVALFLITIFTLSVMSVTRTITDTSDTIDTYIRNSNGKYWAATGANIQTAIWDLNSTKGGFVRLPNLGEDVYEVAATIYIPEYFYGFQLIGEHFQWWQNGTVLRATAAMDYIIEDLRDGIGFHQFINIGFDGEVTTYGGSVTGLKTTCQDVVIQQCSFFDCYKGLYVKSNAWVDKCWIESNTYWGMSVNGEKPKITDNIFWNNNLYDIVFTGNAINAIVTDNTADDTDYFIYFNRVTGSHINSIFSNNVATDMDDAMFYLARNDFTDCLFSNNVVNGEADTTSFIKNEGDEVYTNVSIIGNIAHDITGDFITFVMDGMLIKDNPGYNYDSLRDDMIWNSNGKYWSYDGTADEVQIHAAMTDLGTDGGTVYLPSDTLTISDAIEWAYDGINLVGEGMDATHIVLADGANVRMVDIGADEGGANDGFSNFVIEGIHFDGNNDSQTWSYNQFGIEICSDSSNITIRNCEINNTGNHAIRVYYDAGNIIPAKYITVEDCVIRDLHRWVPADGGATIGYSSGIVFAGQHCTARNNYIYDTWGTGIAIEDYTYLDARDCVIDGNHITGAIAFGIYMEGGASVTTLAKSGNCTIINNIVHDLNSTAYGRSPSASTYMDYGVGIIVGRDSICSNNQIYNIPDIGILYTGHNSHASASIISGNTIDFITSLNKTGHAITTQSAADDSTVVITGNIIKNVVDYGIYIRCNMIIEGNYICYCAKGIYGTTGTENVSIIGNNVFDTTEDGIFLYASHSCIVSNNRVYTKNGEGIQCSGSSDYNIVTGNMLMGCTTPWNTGGNANSVTTGNLPAWS